MNAIVVAFLGGAFMCAHAFSGDNETEDWPVSFAGTVSDYKSAWDPGDWPLDVKRDELESEGYVGVAKVVTERDGGRADDWHPVYLLRQLWAWLTFRKPSKACDLAIPEEAAVVQGDELMATVRPGWRNSTVLVPADDDALEVDP